MKINRSRLLLSALFVAFFMATAAVVLTDDAASSPVDEKAEVKTDAKTEIKTDEKAEAKAETKAAPVSHISADPNACVAGASAIEDLNRQREKLQAREKELTAKEAELKSLEKAVKEEFTKLDDARTEFAKAGELKKKENEEKVAKVVETLETMGPKPASAILASLDDALAITAMQRMSTPKLAKILNIMETGRSSHLTELLAGVVRVRGAELNSSRLSTSSGVAATAKMSTKGGEKNDGKN